jgi:putative glutamine transport system permease protein
MAIAYIDTVRPLPTFLILVVVYFGLARLRFGFSPIGAGVVGLACYHAARMAEVIRSGIQSVEKGQTLAARSLGLTYLQSMRYVVMPIGVRRMIPALTTEVLMVIKNTSLTLVVGVGEVLNRGQIIYSKYLNPVPTLLIVAALFWLTCYPLSRLSRKLEVAEETSAAL